MRAFFVFWIGFLVAGQAFAATLSSGTYTFAFSASLATEMFELYDSRDCTGVFAASDPCLAGATETGRNVTFSAGAGFAALDAAGIGTPAAAYRNRDETGLLTIDLDVSELGGDWHFGPTNTVIECRIGTYICGGSRYGAFRLIMTLAGPGQVDLQADYHTYNWVAGFTPTRHFSYHLVDIVTGLGVRGNNAEWVLSDFRMLGGPPVHSAPLPPAFALLAVALVLPGALRRRRAAAD